MPAPETLSFSCPHCSTRLTVPANYAGITGPCPSCREAITAPALPEEAPEPQPPEIEPIPVAEAPGEVPTAGPELPPVPVLSPAIPEPEAKVDVEAPPAEETVPTEAAAVLQSETSSKIKPEPRHVKERPAAAPIAVRHSTEDESLRKTDGFPAYSHPKRNGSRVLRLSGAAAFCAAATTVSYLLLYFFLPSGPAKRLKAASGPLSVQAPAEGVFRGKSAEIPTPHEAVHSLQSEDLPPQEPVEAPGPVEESPAILANNALDAFLSAKDAASRVGLVEPAATAEELEATLLNKPLPEVAQILPDLAQHDPVEQFTDYPYRVSFFLQNGRNVDFAILVRQRGNQSPKVFLPAFLDLAGGRLSSFAKTPNDSEPATFHVILDPLSVCHDESVPGADRKITFKLLPSMFGKEITRAYVSSGSRFAQMVGDPNSSLRWGVRMRATVTIQWNKTEDPQKPYLELMNINALNWNS